MTLFTASCWRDEGISDIHHLLHKQVQSIKHGFTNNMAHLALLLSFSPDYLALMRMLTSMRLIFSKLCTL